MKRLVSDTGPLLHLHEAGALHLLPLIGETIIPPVVLDEIRIHAPEFYRAQEWLKLPTVPETVRQRANAWVEGGFLHRGEAEALAVALEVQPDWFLTDDAAARVMGESLGLETRGSLGIVLWVAAMKKVERNEAEACLSRLENSSLWLSPRVRTEARAALARIFAEG